MKNRILTFIIGVLVGGIISTSIFFFLLSNKNMNRFNMPDMNMPNGEMNGMQRPTKGDNFNMPSENI